MRITGINLTLHQTQQSNAALHWWLQCSLGKVHWMQGMIRSQLKLWANKFARPSQHRYWKRLDKCWKLDFTAVLRPIQASTWSWVEDGGERHLQWKTFSYGSPQDGQPTATGGGLIMINRTRKRVNVYKNYHWQCIAMSCMPFLICEILTIKIGIFKSVCLACKVSCDIKCYLSRQASLKDMVRNV